MQWQNCYSCFIIYWTILFPSQQIMHEYTSLENFWKRYNKVLLDKVALDKEKSTLLDENQQLRTVLKQYLDGISVNDEILSQVNPLFVVNQRTNVQYVEYKISCNQIQTEKPVNVVPCDRYLTIFISFTNKDVVWQARNYRLSPLWSWLWPWHPINQSINQSK